MGGRGASSGISDKGKPYGTEFYTVYQEGNIKFIRPNSHDSELYDTKTNGRIYVTITGYGEGAPKSIYYFDGNLRKTKNIDLTHKHDGKKPHTHHGYEHAESGTTGLSLKEKRMIDRVYKIWYNHIGK